MPSAFLMLMFALFAFGCHSSVQLEANIDASNEANQKAKQSAAAPDKAVAIAAGTNNNLADFPRLPSDTSDSQRIQRAIDASSYRVLTIPAGEYLLDTQINLLNGASLKMHKSARLKAVKKIGYILYFDGARVFDRNSVSSVFEDYNIFIEGGDFDCNGLSNGIFLKNFHHITFKDATIRNAKQYGLKINDAGRTGRGYELVASNIYMRCNMPGLAGNVGICLDDSDNHFIDCIIVDYTVGIFVRNGGSNRFTRCHVWGGPIPAPAEGQPREMLKDSVCFDLSGGETILTDCYADTGMIGFKIAATSRLFGCSVFNNYGRFKMNNPVSISHERGTLLVSGCLFTKTSPNAFLYKGKGKNLIWRDNIINRFSADELGLPKSLIKQDSANVDVYDNSQKKKKL